MPEPGAILPSALTWLTIPAGNNGGNFYSGTDAANITLRLYFQNVNLTGINSNTSTTVPQGFAVLGVRSPTVAGDFESPAAFELITDATQKRKRTPDGCVFGELLPQFGSVAGVAVAGGSHWVEAQANRERDRNAGWNTGLTGGGIVPNQVYDTFDVMMEFAPQVDGTIHMYVFSRIYTTPRHLFTGHDVVHARL